MSRQSAYGRKVGRSRRDRNRRTAMAIAARKSTRQNDALRFFGLSGRHRKPIVILMMRIVAVVVKSAVSRSIAELIAGTKARAWHHPPQHHSHLVHRMAFGDRRLCVNRNTPEPPDPTERRNSA